MHSEAAERIEGRRHDGCQRLALAGSHLDDVPVVQGERGEELHVEWAEAKRATRRLAGDGKERDAGDVATQATKGLNLRAQLGVTAAPQIRFQGVDVVEDRRVEMQVGPHRGSAHAVQPARCHGVLYLASIRCTFSGPNPE
jgi:hypothetical protein